MSNQLLTVLVMLPTALVVVALFLIMWRGQRTGRQATVALVSGAVLAAWAALISVLGARGFFVPPDTRSAPPVGIALGLALLGLAGALALSPSLRSLLTNQKSLLRLNVWRLEGLVFLLLMADGQMPALWALPAGVGDFLVGATAFWVAGRLDAPGGRRRAIAFNLFGLADLVVAISLGIMTNPGPAQVFHTTPTAELVTRFPMVLVPTFMVPLAIVVHVVLLWQLSGRRWVS